MLYWLTPTFDFKKLKLDTHVISLVEKKNRPSENQFSAIEHFVTDKINARNMYIDVMYQFLFITKLFLLIYKSHDKM